MSNHSDIDDEDDLIVETAKSEDPVEEVAASETTSTPKVTSEEPAASSDAAEPVDETLEPPYSEAAPAAPGPNEPKGQKFQLSETGTEVYVTHSPSRHTARLIILLTNSLGLASKNNLLLADSYAEKLNCPVIVPDLFDKDPILVPGAEVPDTEDEQGVDPGFSLNKLKAFAVGAIKGFMDEMWLAKHTFERTYPALSNTISEIVQVYSPQSLGVIGYSFGARYVLRLLEEQRNDEWTSDEDQIAVGACIHPSLVDQADFDSVSKPLILVHSAHDPVLSESVVQAGIASLQERGVTFDRKVFDSTDTVHPLPHGFAVPGDYPESEVGDKPSQVLNYVSDWIQAHL